MFDSKNQQLWFICLGAEDTQKYISLNKGYFFSITILQNILEIVRHYLNQQVKNDEF